MRKEEKEIIVRGFDNSIKNILPLNSIKINQRNAMIRTNHEQRYLA